MTTTPASQRKVYLHSLAKCLIPDSSRYDVILHGLAFGGAGVLLASEVEAVTASGAALGAEGNARAASALALALALPIEVSVLGAISDARSRARPIVRWNATASAAAKP